VVQARIIVFIMCTHKIVTTIFFRQLALIFVAEFAVVRSFQDKIEI
jgi:hypothetical protein